MNERGPFSEAVRMSNARLCVVDADFEAFAGDLVDDHAAEFAQWAKQDGLSSTACAILAVLSYFRGLRRVDELRGRLGCGLQVSVDCWARILGRSRRQVQYAFTQLAERKLIKRVPRYVRFSQPWTDSNGRTHTEADIRSVTYLTRLGAQRIAERGQTVRSYVQSGKRRVGRFVCGVVDSLLTAFQRKSSAIHLRVTDAADHCTPSFGEARSASPNEAKKGAPLSGSPTFLRGSGPQKCVDKLRDRHRGRLAQERGKLDRESDRPIWREPHWSLAEAERCWRENIFTAATWEPTRWAKANADERRHLTLMFEPVKRELAKFMTGALERQRAAQDLYEREAF